jgi:G:T/U-mismatch repair DNA glycosylase
MIIQKDEIPSYIPDNPRLIILGTMCAINARTINGKRPVEDFFYYNDNRNHFWKILQYIFNPSGDPKRLSINEKKNFLKKHRVGIQNLVAEIQIPNNEKLDPSDTVLFECWRKKKIKYKTLSPMHKKNYE